MEMEFPILTTNHQVSVPNHPVWVQNHLVLVLNLLVLVQNHQVLVQNHLVLVPIHKVCRHFKIVLHQKQLHCNFSLEYSCLIEDLLNKKKILYHFIKFANIHIHHTTNKSIYKFVKKMLNKMNFFKVNFQHCSLNKSFHFCEQISFFFVMCIQKKNFDV